MPGEALQSVAVTVTFVVAVCVHLGCCEVGCVGAGQVLGFFANVGLGFCESVVALAWCGVFCPVQDLV
jgi:hypothetical protein